MLDGQPIPNIPEAAVAGVAARGNSLARVIGVATFAVAAASACAGPGSWQESPAPDTLGVAVDDRPEPPPPPGESPAERCQAWARDGLSVSAATRDQIRNELGEPVVVNVEVEPNRHMVGATDSLFALRYEGVEFHLRTPPAGNDLLERVAVSHARHLRYSRPTIGDSREVVLEALGPPAVESSPDHLIYECSTGLVENPMHFLLTDGRVSEIWFSYYVD